MVKHFLLSMGMLASTITLFSQQVLTPKFDERTELLSVVFRLTDAHEYNLCQFPQYAKETDVYFADFKNDTAVSYAKKIHDISVNYDAPMSFALRLTWDHDTLALDRSLQEDENYRARWPEIYETHFLSLLNDFYRKSHFHQFYMSHQTLYEQTAQAMQTILNEIDFKWFQTFFVPSAADVEKTSYHVILSILNGPHNYGTQNKLANGDCQMFSVMGCCRSNDDNEPEYQKESVLPIIVHEFCHSYCNPLNDEFWNVLKSGARKVFKVVKEPMSKQAYGHPIIMMNETFVRASVICYMTSHYDDLEVEKLVKDEEALSFILVRDYVQALQNRENHRDSYPNMHTFMPQFRQILDNFSVSNYKKQQKAFLKQCAHLTCSLTDGQKDVPSGETVITITFDKPMVPGIALSYGRLGVEAFPKLVKHDGNFFAWSDDHRKLQIFVQLEPATTYSLCILGEHFNTEDGHRGIGKHFIDFTTAK